MCVIWSKCVLVFVFGSRATCHCWQHNMAYRSGIYIQRVFGDFSANPTTKTNSKSNAEAQKLSLCKIEMENSIKLKKNNNNVKQYENHQQQKAVNLDEEVNEKRKYK